MAPRRGRFHSPHGSFETPCFAPVGTAATVKGMLPDQVRDLGAELILANTYHLALRPGPELIREAGGLHAFMDWKGPILTDSGGYQVFSLEGKRSIRDEGVRFAGADSGKELTLTPRSALEIQRDLGSDIAMVLDECPPAAANRKKLERASARTILWATEARRIHREWGGKERGQAVFGIVQGGADKELRRSTAEALVELDFDAYAIGGVSVGEGKELMYEATAYCTPHLPEDKLRYLMGVGDPDDLFEAVLLGIDLFDCVSPTRHGRTKLAYVPSGKMKLRNAQFREDFSPLDSTCDCPACTRFTRAYLRHLAVCDEMLGSILLGMHNIRFLERLMESLRERILKGDAERELREWFASAYPGWARTPKHAG